jgi:hypothetical protein
MSALYGMFTRISKDVRVTVPGLRVLGLLWWGRWDLNRGQMEISPDAGHLRARNISIYCETCVTAPACHGLTHADQQTKKLQINFNLKRFSQNKRIDCLFGAGGGIRTRDLWAHGYHALQIMSLTPKPECVQNVVSSRRKSKILSPPLESPRKKQS